MLPVDDDGQIAEAMRVALGFIAKRDRFEAAVREHLAGFPAGVIDAVIHRLRGQRVLDDDRLLNLIASKNKGKKAVSAARLKERLRAEGASAAALSQLPCEISALQVLGAKFVLSTARPTQKEMARAARLLVSRGFDQEEIASALEAIFGEQEA